MDSQLKMLKADGHKAPEGQKPRHRNFLSSAILVGALAGCAGGFIAVPYGISRLPENGDACPSVGPSFQVFQGQEIGFGTARRPLYVARVTRMDGSDVTLDFRTPLAPPAARESSVSYVVTLGGIRTDTDGLGRLANSSCTLVNGIRGTRSDGGTAGAPSAASDGGAAGSDAGAGGAAPVRPASRPQELDGTPFPRDVSAEFSRTLSERLGDAVSAAFGMLSGSSGSTGRAELSIERSDDTSFTLSVRNAQSVKLYRRVEVQWDVSVPQEATLRVPYRITSLRADGGRLSASVSLDCSRDMEVAGRGLDARSGPHPLCADPAQGIEPSRKK